MIKHPVY